MYVSVPVVYLKYDVSEAEFCLRYQMEPTQSDTERLVLSIGSN
jgi:hypothetical protein